MYLIRQFKCLHINNISILGYQIKYHLISMDSNSSTPKKLQKPFQNSQQTQNFERIIKEQIAYSTSPTEKQALKQAQQSKKLEKIEEAYLQSNQNRPKSTKEDQESLQCSRQNAKSETKSKKSYVIQNIISSESQEQGAAEFTAQNKEKQKHDGHSSDQAQNQIKVKSETNNHKQIQAQNLMNSAADQQKLENVEKLDQIKLLQSKNQLKGYGDSMQRVGQKTKEGVVSQKSSQKTNKFSAEILVKIRNLLLEHVEEDQVDDYIQKIAQNMTESVVNDAVAKKNRQKFKGQLNLLLQENENSKDQEKSIQLQDNTNQIKEQVRKVLEDFDTSQQYEALIQKILAGHVQTVAAQEIRKKDRSKFIQQIKLILVQWSQVKNNDNAHKIPIKSSLQNFHKQATNLQKFLNKKCVFQLNTSIWDEQWLSQAFNKEAVIEASNMKQQIKTIIKSSQNLRTKVSSLQSFQDLNNFINQVEANNHMPIKNLKTLKHCLYLNYVSELKNRIIGFLEAIKGKNQNICELIFQDPQNFYDTQLLKFVQEKKSDKKLQQILVEIKALIEQWKSIKKLSQFPQIVEILQIEHNLLNQLGVKKEQLKRFKDNKIAQIERGFRGLNLLQYLQKKLTIYRIRFIQSFNSVFQNQIKGYRKVEDVKQEATQFIRLSDYKLLSKKKKIKNALFVFTVQNQELKYELDLESQEGYDCLKRQKSIIKKYPGKKYLIKVQNRIIEPVLNQQFQYGTIISFVSNAIAATEYKVQKEYINIKAKLKNSEQQVAINDCIKNTQVMKEDQVKNLVVQIEAKIIVYYESMQTQIRGLLVVQTIRDLKQKIQKQFSFPTDSQTISGIRANLSEQQQFDENTVFKQISPNSNQLVFNLRSKSNLLHFGFHERVDIKYDDFAAFFVQKAEDKKQMIQNLQFNDQDQTKFLKRILPYLFSALKKRFNFDIVIQQFRSLISDITSQQIWLPQSGYKSTFTSNLIANYLLFNSESKLRIILMNLMKNIYPIPVYFRVYQNINYLNNQWILNEDLIWILQSSINIASMGIHSQFNMKNQYGKSSLLNQLFYVNFLESQYRHPICHGAPDIILSIYTKFIQTNIIDVPRNTSEQIKKHILKSSNILILHSWKAQKQTQEEIRAIKKQFPQLKVICFLRDQSLILKSVTMDIKKSNFSDGVILPLVNLKQVDKKISLFNCLRNKLNYYIKQVFDASSHEQKKRIFKCIQNPIFSQFENLIEKMNGQMKNLSKIAPQYQKIRRLQKKKDKSEQIQNQIKKMQQQAKKQFINPILEEIFIYISQNPKNVQLLMMRLRQNIKKFKAIAEKPFNLVYQFIKRIQNLNESQKQIFIKEIQSIQESLKKIVQIDISLKQMTKQKMIQKLVLKGFELENQIKPTIFSIEIAWRQLSYLNNLNPNALVGSKHLEEFLVDVKTSQIAIAQPFELIDGDLLEMPKKLMKKMFSMYNKKVAVISILGPQSSGKSTLLNFLFGCDFQTSQGRCTRGVYGTYFDFTGSSLFGCEGIFLVDTQGLFAILNKKDEKSRKDFDSKLVLFCLTISDIVIINTKGNIDNQTEKKLRSAMEKFEVLVQQNCKPPEFFLVLNQNNSSSTSTSNADINKLTEIFPRQSNSCSLAQAYEIQEIGMNQICILQNEDKIVKKKAKGQFLNQCLKMQDKIMKTINKRGNLRKMCDAIDQMERMWSTIEAFPNLGDSSSKKARQLQQKIRKWRYQLYESQIYPFLRDLTSKYKEKKLSRTQCQNKLTYQIDKAKKMYITNFKSDQDLSDQLLNKTIIQQKNLELSLLKLKTQLINSINDIQLDAAVKKSKQQGNQQINQAIRKIKILQDKQQRNLSQNEKRQIFKQSYQKIINKTKATINVQSQIKDSFQKIFEHYSSAMQQSAIHKISGLPSHQWELDILKNQQQFQKSISQSIADKFKNWQNVIQISNSPPTKILEGGKTDVSFKYFDMKQYFQPIQIKRVLIISRQFFQRIIKKQLILTEIKKKYQEQRNEQKQNILNGVAKYINCIIQQYNLELTSLNNFKSLYQAKSLRNSYNQKKTNLKVVERKYQSPDYWVQDQYKYKQFIQYQTLTKRIQQISKHPYRSQHLVHFSNCLQKDVILWEKIKQHLQCSKSFQETKKQINKRMLQKLNKQAASINLQLKCNDLQAYLQHQENPSHYKKNQTDRQNNPGFLKKAYNYVVGSNNQSKKKNPNHLFISQKNPDLDIINLQSFYTNLKRLFYFDRERLQKHIEKVQKDSMQKDCLILGFINQSQFNLKNSKEYPQSLSKYLSDNSQQVFKTLRSNDIKKFIIHQLRKDQKMKLLFKNLRQTVSDCSQNFNKKTIQSVFIKVNKQLTIFNNDLNQVSYKLTLFFNGYCHLYVVYMIWKKFSEIIKQQKGLPIFQLQKDKENQWNHFQKMTSNKVQQICQAQAITFIRQFISIIQQKISTKKQLVINQKIKSYKLKNTRQNIQQQVDATYFSRNTKIQDVLLYLQDPKKIIQQAYQHQVKLFLKQIGRLFVEKDQIQELYQQIIDSITSIEAKFFSNTIRPQQGFFHDFFTVNSKQTYSVSIGDSVYQENKWKLFITYFFDILNDSTLKQYQNQKFIAIPKISCFYSNRKPKQCLQFAIQRIKKANNDALGINNIVNFINSVKKHIGQAAKKIYQNKHLSKQDQKYFREEVLVTVCGQKCPGCQRICGFQNVHKYHSCIFGHQMRALGQVTLKNGEASVLRCQDLEPNSLIQFNGRSMNWIEFQKEWEQNQKGAIWKFDDLIPGNRQDIFKLAWEIAGQQFCKKKGMNHVAFNKANILAQKNIGSIHYIYALDCSGSMNGTPWQQVINGFNDALNELALKNNSSGAIKVSLIVFDNESTIVQQGTAPQDFKSSVAFTGGGTQFNKPFQDAIYLIKKNVSVSKMVFIIMSDGGASYPLDEVKQFRNLQIDNPGRVQFYGLQFGNANQTLKTIAQDLDGKTQIAYNQQGVASFYIEIIKRNQDCKI